MPDSKDPFQDSPVDGRSRPLWAPWRIAYIRGERPQSCFICEHARDAGDDGKGLVIARGRVSFVMLNAYPYNSGHALVSPFRHVADLSDLRDNECDEIMRLIRRIKETLTTVMRPEGFNIGFNIGAAAGAGVRDHVHGHVVPRWEGDTNFMPVLGNTRVVPEALTETARILRTAWADEQR